MGGNKSVHTGIIQESHSYNIFSVFGSPNDGKSLFPPFEPLFSFGVLVPLATLAPFRPWPRTFSRIF